MGAQGFSNLEHKAARAIYGVDIIIDQNLTPKILEVNFFPNCQPLIDQFPSFTNDVFNCLFHDEVNNIVEL